MLIGRGVGKRYGARVVLRRLNFDIAAGGVAAVVGRNGSGKSTLLRVVAALTNLDAGSIEWQENDASLTGEAMRSLCGLCAPDVPLYRELTCGENLQFWSQLRPASTCSEEDLRARLENWELGARWNDLAGDLSSGLRARLALCVATLHAPPVLLLDEPGANLDAAGRLLLQRALEEQRARGVALLATNDAREIELCDCTIEVESVPIVRAN